MLEIAIQSSFLMGVQASFVGRSWSSVSWINGDPAVELCYTSASKDFLVLPGSYIICYQGTDISHSSNT